MNTHLPDDWLRSEWTTQFFGGLASAPTSLLLLDYDGTLAPFNADRLKAILYPGVKERLERLLTLPRTRVILISGRKAQELYTLLDLSRPIEIWGSHGREHLQVDGGYQMDDLTSYERRILESVRQALEKTFNAEVVEVKPSSIAVHWRRSSAGSFSPPEIRQRMEDLYRQLPPPGPGDGILHLLEFDGGLELRAGNINKGHAVIKVLEAFSSETPVAFLGDDLTDEDAFSVLRERGLAVLVRAEPRPSQARLWLNPPEDLLHFLDTWIAAVEKPL